VLRRHLREFAPDVVAWWPMGAMSLSMIELVRGRGLPAVGFVHDRWMLYGPGADGWQRTVGRFGPAARAAGVASRVPTQLELGRSARWVFSSEALRRETLESLPLADTGVAHPGIESALFPAAPRREWTGRLLYVGRIDAPKGIATAITALVSLPEMILDVVGTGAQWHEAELRDLARDLGLADRVRFRGPAPRSGLAEAYAGADAVVFPVLWEEPWGLVPLEAMAVGRPVVATGSGGSAEYLRHERNCLIFEPRDDPGALVEALGRLASDAALRRRLRENGFETARGHSDRVFNEAVARELESVVAR
jgi:glycosyltransferase involved in cell wall biosynthesis